MKKSDGNYNNSAESPLKYLEEIKTEMLRLVIAELDRVSTLQMPPSLIAYKEAIVSVNWRQHLLTEMKKTLSMQNAQWNRAAFSQYFNAYRKVTDQYYPLSEEPTFVALVSNLLKRVANFFIKMNISFFPSAEERFKMDVLKHLETRSPASNIQTQSILYSSGIIKGQIKR